MIGPIRGNSWRLLISLSLRLRAQCHAAGQPTWISSLRGEPRCASSAPRSAPDRASIGHRPRPASEDPLLRRRIRRRKSRILDPCGETRRASCTLATIAARTRPRFRLPDFCDLASNRECNSLLSYGTPFKLRR